MVVNNTTLLTLGASDTSLALALVFGFMLIAMGFKRSEFLILAGPIWIISGLTIFINYEPTPLFALVGIGLGLVLMFKGVSPYL
jgi:hypothetical protein